MITIRLWQAEDSSALFALFRRSVRETANKDYTPAQIDAWSAGPDDFMERMARRTTFVAVSDGRLAGFIQYEPPDHIDMTYVDAGLQRQGIATMLLAILEEVARKQRAIELRVEASITARPFFEARGYKLLTAQTVHARGQSFLNYRMLKRPV